MRWWVGQVTHEDDLEGLETFLVIPDDLEDEADAVIHEAKQDDWCSWDAVQLVPQSVFEGLKRAIETDRDTADLGDGLLADLTEPYDNG